MKRIKCLMLIALVTFLMGCGNNSGSVDTGKDANNNQQDTTEVVSTEGTSSTDESNTEDTSKKDDTTNVDTSSDTNTASNNDTSSTIDTTDNKEASNTEVIDNDTSKGVESKKQGYLDKYYALEQSLETSLAAKKSGTTLDMRDAAATEYKSWDDLLNEAYTVLIEQLPAEEMEAVRQEETSWISERDTKAQEAANQYTGGTMEPLAYESSLAASTKERCYELINNYMK